MSRILRRPMFRGGRVSAYGTGIAHGLADGGMAPDGRQKFFEGGISTAMMNELTGGSNIRTGGQLLKDAITPFQKGLYGQNVKMPNWMSRVGNWLKPGNVAGVASRYGLGSLPFLYAGGAKILQESLPEELQDEGGIYDRTGGWGAMAAGADIAGTGVDEVLAGEVDITKDEEKEADESEKTAAQLEIDRLNKIIEGEEKPEVDARTAVAENKALFADLLGIDKARGQDISDMLLGFAGAEGDDTWSKFQSFARDEAKRPGRRRKISDAAGTLAIQDYIAGKRSKEQIEKLKQVETFKMDEQLKRIYPQADDDWLDAIRKGAGKEGSISSDTTITKALAPRARAEGKSINPSLTKTTLEEVNKDQDDFKIGYTIVTLSKENGRKVIIERTATDIKVREDLPVF